MVLPVMALPSFVQGDCMTKAASEPTTAVSSISVKNRT
jgi:hypothetical protein